MNINVDALVRINELKGKAQITDEDLAFLTSEAEAANGYKLQLMLTQHRSEVAMKQAARYKDALMEVLMLSKAAVADRNTSLLRMVEIARLSDKAVNPSKR